MYHCKALPSKTAWLLAGLPANRHTTAHTKQSLPFSTLCLQLHVSQKSHNSCSAMTMKEKTEGNMVASRPGLRECARVRSGKSRQAQRRHGTYGPPPQLIQGPSTTWEKKWSQRQRRGGRYIRSTVTDRRQCKGMCWRGPA